MPRDLGTFLLASERVRLLVDPGFTGGHFNLKDGAMVVGLAEGRYSDVRETLIHETAEWFAARRGLRFERAPEPGRSTSSLLFCMMHDDFSSMCAAVAGWLRQVDPVVYRAWRAHSKAARRKS